MSTSEYPDASAAIRDLIAAHAHAQDAGRATDVVALYTSDAVLEGPGIGRIEGHDALLRAFSAWTPAKPQMHLVGNTVVNVQTETEATAVSNVVFFQRGESGWEASIVGCYDDAVVFTEDGWRLSRRTTTFQP